MAHDGIIDRQFAHLVGNNTTIGACAGGHLMPLPRFVSLSKREADLAITIERPQRGPYVCSKLCDYTLRLLWHPGVFKPPCAYPVARDLNSHSFIGYVEEHLFSERLRYLEDLLPASRVVLRSTSVIAQYYGALQGQSLAILPCFIAVQEPRLVPVLEHDIVITGAASGCTVIKICAISNILRRFGTSCAKRSTVIPTY